jgi:hypothetical protein
VSKLTVRRAIILVLVAAGCLLVVPGMAGAGVRAKYRAEYKAKVNGLDRTFSIYATAYDNAKSASLELAGTLAATSDHDLRVIYEQQALSTYTAYLGKPEEWNLSYARMINGLKAGATRYFAVAGQRTRFKAACDRLKSYAGMLILLANVHVYDSFRDLGSEPPDYVTSQAMLDAGDEDAAEGHEGFDKWRTALRALQ